jgi:predicted PurR-regulated permease PerM
MAKGKVKITLLLSAFILFLFFLMANRPLVGQEETFQTSVTQKLDQILKNQENILAQIETTKEEIIRLRKWTR